MSFVASAETSVSYVDLDARGVVFWRYKKGAVVGLTEAEEEVRVIGDLVDSHFEGTSKLIIDIREIASIDGKARKLFASDWVSETYGVQGLALILGSPISTFIGNFWQTINRPKHPTRLFTDVEPALDWVLML